MKLIEFSLKDGAASIVGYVTALDQENIGNYLDEHLEWEPKLKFLEYLKSQVGTAEFTLLKNIYVENTHRGQGLGQELMNQFLTQTQGVVILICDNLELQASQFSLQNWYMNNYGFQETGFTTLSGPILIRN